MELNILKSNSASLKNITTKKLDVLEIVKEDILRILSEKMESTSFEVIKDEIKVAYPYISKAVEELEKDKLIAIQENSILLTKLGQQNAKTVLSKHLVLEKYFKKTRSPLEARLAANVIEHCVSREVITNLKKMSTLRKKGIPLTRFEHNKEGLIVEIDFSDYKLFERVVSMGLFPGEKIMVISEALHQIILKVREKKFALDRSIAERIKALEYGKF